MVFTGMLFVPAVTDHFGLTEAAGPVFRTVIPALVVWFAVLTAVYRFRLLERALGLPPAPAARSRPDTDGHLLPPGGPAPAARARLPAWPSTCTAPTAK
ncbi:hypothetical protein [Geodermatophilus sp. SYSU D01176]